MATHPKIIINMLVCSTVFECQLNFSLNLFRVGFINFAQWVCNSTRTENPIPPKKMSIIKTRLILQSPCQSMRLFVNKEKPALQNADTAWNSAENGENLWGAWMKRNAAPKNSIRKVQATKRIKNLPRWNAGSWSSDCPTAIRSVKETLFLHK